MRRCMTIVTEHRRTHRRWKILCLTCERKNCLSLIYNCFLPLTSSSMLVTGVKGFYCNWPHSITHARARTHTLGRTPPDERSARSRDFYLTTHNMRDIHAAGGIRTRSTRKPAAADPRLIQHGYWDRCLRHFIIYHFLGLKASEQCWWRLNYFDKRFDMDW